MKQRRNYAKVSSQSRGVLLAVMAGVALVLTLGAFTVWHGNMSVSQSHGPTSGPRLMHVKRAPVVGDNQTGVAGIKPSLKLSATGRNDLGLSGEAGLATYTAAEAGAYALTSHPTVNLAAPITSADVKVAFMTDSAAGTYLAHQDIGQSADRVVCVVQVRATFTISVPGNISYSPNYTAPKPAAGYYYMVFDGITGNLLLLTPSHAIDASAMP